MANKFTNWLGQNKLNVALSAPDLVSLAKGEDKLKSLKNLILNIAFGTQVLQYAMSKAWGGMSKGLKSVLHSTGSLQAALSKLEKAQGLEKIFTPLVGGAAAARTEVAKLINLAASKDMKFDSVADAASNMRTLSRGAIGSAEDLDVLIDLSKATGASLDALGSSVAGVSQAMQSGESIERYVESLREAGGITDVAARSLITLQQNGGTAAQVMDALGESMKSVTASAAGAAETLDEVNRAYELTQERIKESAGSPWIEAEIESTKAWKAIMDSVAPAIATVSGWLEVVFNGASRFGIVIKTLIADSGILSAAIYILGGALAVLVPVITVIGSLGLVSFLDRGAAAFGLTTARVQTFSKWLDTATRGMISATAAGRVLGFAMKALDVAMAAMKWVMIVTTIAQVIGVIVELFDGTKKTDEEVRKLSQSSDQLNSKLRDQINHVETLAEKYAALNAALDASGAAWAAYNKAKSEGQPEEVVEQLRRNAIKADRTAQLAEQAGVGEDAKKAIEREKTERARAQTEREAAMEKAGPEEKAKLLRAEAARLGGMAAEGGIEIDEKDRTARKVLEIDIEKAKRRKINKGADVSDLNKQQLDIMSASGSRQYRADAILQQVELAKNNQGPFAGESPEKLKSRKNAALILKAEGQRYEEERAGNTDSARKNEEAAIALERELSLKNKLISAEDELSRTREAGTRLQIKQIEASIAALDAQIKQEEDIGRAGGVKHRELEQKKTAANRDLSMSYRDLNLQKMGADRDAGMFKAQLKGDAKEMRRLEAESDFTEEFEKLRPIFGDEEASRRARSITETKVSLRDDAQRQAVAAAAAVSDLARVGGGGGVESVNDLMKQQLNISDLQLKVLQKIEQRDPEIMKLK